MFHAYGRLFQQKQGIKTFSLNLANGSIDEIFLYFFRKIELEILSLEREKGEYPSLDFSFSLLILLIYLL